MNDSVFIYGAPGSGKTQALQHFINRLKRQDDKVMVCQYPSLLVDRKNQHDEQWDIVRMSEMSVSNLEDWLIGVWHDGVKPRLQGDAHERTLYFVIDNMQEELRNCDDNQSRSRCGDILRWITESADTANVRLIVTSVIESRIQNRLSQTTHNSMVKMTPKQLMEIL